MFCIHCGSKNPEGTQFCTSCGAPMASVTEAVDSESYEPEVSEAYQQTAPDSPEMAPDDPIDAPTNSAAPFVVPSAPSSTVAAKKPFRPGIAIIAGAAVLFAVVATVAIGIINHTVMSPKNEVSAYVDALAAGDYDKATEIADPGIEKANRAGLNAKIGADAKNRIQDAKIGAVQNNGDGTQNVAVSFSLDGKQQRGFLTVEPAGRKWLFFDSWHITTPLIATLAVNVPPSMTSVSINGVTIDVAQAGVDAGESYYPDDMDEDDDTDYSQMREYDLAVYPGSFTLSAPSSDYISVEPVTLHGTADPAYLVPRASDSLTSAITDEVQKYVEACTASDALEKEGCEFSNGYFTDDFFAYSDIKRKALAAPVLDSLDVLAGTFSTDYIEVSIDYKYRYSDDEEWDTDSDSDSGWLEGTFSVEDGKLTVIISDDESY